MSRSLAVRVAPALPGRGTLAVTERNWLVAKRLWLLMLSGFFEPVFYLCSIGIGVGALVGSVTVGERVVDYTAFVAPALLAASAMNGAIYDSTMNVFHKLRYAKTYDGMLATPVGPRDVALGEIAWAQLRGTAYSAAFVLVMLCAGLIDSWWGVLALPAAVLIGFAFAALGMAATTFMRGWADLDWIQVAVMPMFLFATTFYPLSVYPSAARPLIQLTPLYHGIELLRSLTTGIGVGPALLGHVAYLIVLAAIGLAITARRLERLLLR